MANVKKEKIQIIKNSFPICQIKKMIGKKLIIPWPSLVITTQDRNNAKIMKAKIIEFSLANDTNDVAKHITTKKPKHLIITAMCNNDGILQVFKNIDVLLAINSISYKELSDGIGKDIFITIHQYPKLSKTEIKTLL